ncbi:MAG: hypothetical protein IPL69_19115 [Saprospiraceae bacterium]|nr:hypothetical protein [Candidatus Brachybacter algidus]
MNLFTKKFYVLSAIALIIASLTAWVDDPPNYHTGAPGELTCGSCHIAPTSNASTGLIEIVGLPDTLSPDTDYPIKIRITKTFGTASQAGFQMTLINERLEKWAHSAIHLQVLLSQSKTIGTISNIDLPQFSLQIIL